LAVFGNSGRRNRGRCQQRLYAATSLKAVWGQLVEAGALLFAEHVCRIDARVQLYENERLAGSPSGLETLLYVRFHGRVSVNEQD